MTVNQIMRARLREAIASSKLPLKTVSSRSGYSPNYIAALAGRRAGRPCNPTIGAVWALARALEVDPMWLLGD